ncbi:MAG: hypothetical protein WBI36_02940 [Erysipelotrichaceae bacterium]
MSINKVLSFLKRQGVLAVTNNKRLDTDLATAYLSVLFESDKYSDQYVNNKDYFANSVKNAFMYFDGNGFVNKIYVSLCYFFDEVLSKEDYYFLNEKLIHKMYITKHLSKYINMHNFINNCKLDFDPSTIEFEKTEGMLLKDEETFVSGLKRDFHYQRIVLCYDQLPGLFVFDTSTTFLDLEKAIYVYFFDVNNNAYQFDDEAIQVNKKRKTVTVTLPMRANVIITNSPIIRKTVQKLDDLIVETEQSEEKEVSIPTEKIDETITLSSKQDLHDVKEETEQQTQQEQLPKTEIDEIVEDEKEEPPLTSKEIRANPQLLAKEKEGLKKAVVTTYTNKFFFYPAISVGKYKLSNKHLKTLDLTRGFCMKGFNLQSYEILDDTVKILGRIADGTIVYEVTKDCHVVIFAGRNPEVR